MQILIGGAWPYANGSLHIGHLAALLPGDVLARYHRAAGDTVWYVSGSDCHGTPVILRAKEEQSTPRVVSDRYHEEFTRVFEALGFSYDRYGKTSSPEHMDFVRAFHRRLYETRYVYEKESPQARCPACGVNLVDRMVLGACPACGEEARGDQCDACGAVLEAPQLIHPRCSTCGAEAELTPQKHLYLAISAMARELSAWVDSHSGWRRNAASFSRRYLEEGLRDRAITRALDWGVDVPREGYADKRVYIWAENVLGYLSMALAVAREQGRDFDALWRGEGAKHYYVHGKDNIPFHTIILPALLMAHGGLRLPDEIVSSEYMKLEGRRVSTSRNWAIWLKDLIGRYDPDALRYYVLANGPEKRDADFSWREFVHSNNSELLGAYGNFVNRSMAFVHRYFGGVVPEGQPDPRISGRVSALYGEVGSLLSRARIKDALELVFACIRACNKYFDEERPWITRETDPGTCARTLHTCVWIVANLAMLTAPFLPFSAARVAGWFGLAPAWAEQRVPAGFALPPTPPLFPRLDRGVAEEELARLLRARGAGLS